MRSYGEITLKYLKENKKRTLFTIVGIILSLSLISGVGFLGLSLKDYLYEITINSDGDYEAQFALVNYKDINALRYDVDLEKVAVLTYEGYYTKVDSEKENYFDVYKVDGEYFKIMNSQRLIEGRVPQAKDEIMINESAKEKLNIKLNDEIALNKLAEDNISTDIVKTYKVVGIEADQYSSTNYFSAYTFLDKVEANKEYQVYLSVIASGNKINTIYEKAKRFNLEDRCYINNDLLALKGESTRAGINIVIKGIVIFIFVVIVIATIFLIYNAINISVAERIKQFGILRSIGATPKQIRSIVFNEGIIMCLISVPFGVAFGYLGVKVTVDILADKIASMFGGDAMVIKFYPVIILFTLVLGLITILLACYGPARKAGKVNVINVIKGNDDGEKIKYYKGTLVRKIFGVEGWIAYKNIRKNSKRFIVTVLSLSISLIMFITFTTLNLKRINELKYIEKTQLTQGHMVLYDNYDEIKAGMKNTEGINTIYGWGSLNIDLPLPSDKLTEEFKVEYPGRMIEIDNSYSEFMFYSNEVLSELGEEQGLKDDEIILINNVAQYSADGKLENIAITNYKEGDTIRIPKGVIDTSSNGEKESYHDIIKDSEENNDYLEFKVKKIIDRDILSADYNYIFGLIVNESNYIKLVDAKYARVQLGYRYPDLKNKEQIEEIKSEIKEIADEYEAVFFDTLGDNQKDEEMWTVINVFVYGFIIMVTLIGVVNVFNTITLNILLKKREYGTLETIGMDSKQLNKMVVLEGLLHGIISSITGGIIAIGLMYIAIKILGYGFTVDHGLYLSPFIMGISANLLIVLIASLIPLRKLKKMSLVETIKASE